jgi:oligoendopeptidase F
VGAPVEAEQAHADAERTRQEEQEQAAWQEAPRLAPIRERVDAARRDANQRGAAAGQQALLDRKAAPDARQKRLPPHVVESPRRRLARTREAVGFDEVE